MAEPFDPTRYTDEYRAIEHSAVRGLFFRLLKLSHVAPARKPRGRQRKEGRCEDKTKIRRRPS